MEQQEVTQTTDQPEETAEEGIRVERIEELSEDEKEIVYRIIEIMKAEDYRVLPFKKVDRLKINEITAKMNKLVAQIQTDNITDANKSLKAVLKKCGGRNNWTEGSD